MNAKSLFFVVLILVTKLVSAQYFSGTVSDESNSPLSDVKVFLLEEKKSVLTDAEGNWSLKAKN